jgi:cell division protein ZapA (FtsZ GTPase activity inhibitor)
MSETKKDIKLNILNRNYNLKCPIDKIDELYQAAQYLEEKLKAIVPSDSDSAANRDSLLTVIALNITNELFAQKKQNIEYLETINSAILELQDRIDQTLGEDS